MENKIIILGVNQGLNGHQMQKAVSDGQDVEACFRELGYKDTDIHLIPKEATVVDVRQFFKTNFQEGLAINNGFFYFSGYCAFIEDNHGELIPNLALVTSDIENPSQLTKAISLEEIYQNFYKLVPNSLTFIFDMCLLDCLLRPYSEQEIPAQLERASWFVAQFERAFPLGARSILMSISQDENHRENEIGGRYSQIFFKTFRNMKQSNLPICPMTAHQKVRYSLMQENQLWGRVLNEQVFSMARCYLDYLEPEMLPQEEESVAPPENTTHANTATQPLSTPTPPEEVSYEVSPPPAAEPTPPQAAPQPIHRTPPAPVSEPTEEDLMLDELDDFDILDEVHHKYEIEGRKFRDETDLINNGLKDKNNWRMRSKAAKILGDEKVESATPALISLTKESNYMVKRAVVEALGKIGNADAYNILKKMARAWPIGDPDETTTKLARAAIRRIEGESSGDFGAL